ncbi:hypothetical protein GWI33_018080 [Rhynchophorus ferrugineus]|uniref:Uncharacterized protein n=1 Tax=Rhynchophorus ferrugineus TaxID=354439 RepID=A0A834M5J1_RHYFE|nr:hypothetical protein GWI33_018080 [Rhynchophorus ferrugineus]
MFQRGPICLPNPVAIYAISPGPGGPGDADGLVGRDVKYPIPEGPVVPFVFGRMAINFHGFPRSILLPYREMGLDFFSSTSSSSVTKTA